jgi:hypothetical protein
MIRSWLWALMTAAAMLAACAPAGADFSGNGNVAATADQVALRATTALALAELAYDSGEEAATAALRSRALDPARTKTLIDAVQRARSLRDQARMLVAAGADASATLEALSAALSGIHALTAN